MAFHQEQRQAGNEIIDKFTTEQPFTILLAQMQSGKTGTYLFTALEMVRLSLVKNVVIICGSSDTSLRAQAQSDKDIAFNSFLEETMEVSDAEGALRLHCYYRRLLSQDLGKLDKIPDESLVIHDNLIWRNITTSHSSASIEVNLDKALMGYLLKRNNVIFSVFPRLLSRRLSRTRRFKLLIGLQKSAVF